MAEMKTLNGYEIVDDAARKNISFIKGTFVTPEMFGAKGDGVTDDSAALQAAFDTGKIVVANGRYFIGDTILVEGKAGGLIGGTLVTNSKDESGRALLKLVYVPSFVIKDVKFTTARDNTNVVAPVGHLRPEGSLSSNVIFIWAQNVNDVLVENVTFENSENDICLYNCGNVYVNRFKSTGTSCCSYMRNNGKVSFYNGSVTPYDLIGKGDHHFYIGEGNDEVKIESVDMFANQHSGYMPVHSYPNKENAAEYGFTKRVSVNDCYIEYTEFALYTDVDETFVVKNSVLKSVYNEVHYVMDLYDRGSTPKIIFENVCFKGDNNLIFGPVNSAAEVRVISCTFGETFYSALNAWKSTFDFIDCIFEKDAQWRGGATATYNCKMCLFNTRVRFIGSKAGGVFNVANSTFGDSVEVQGAALSEYNFYRCKIKGPSYYAVISVAPTDRVKFYYCELLANGNGVFQVANNDAVLTVVGCYGDNANASQKYLEYNGSFTPTIKCYNCFFPTLEARTDAIVGQYNTFKD